MKCFAMGPVPLLSVVRLVWETSSTLLSSNRRSVLIRLVEDSVDTVSGRFSSAARPAIRANNIAVSLI